MGHHVGASAKEGKVLQLLRTALPGYYVQCDTSKKDLVLYSQLDLPLHSHIVTVRARLLSSIGQR